MNTFTRNTRILLILSISVGLLLVPTQIGYADSTPPERPAAASPSIEQQEQSTTGDGTENQSFFTESFDLLSTTSDCSLSENGSRSYGL